MEITITKVAIIDGLFPRISYTEHLPDNDERKHPNVICTSPGHEDLIKAFKAFKPHLALICEEITSEQFIESIPNEYDATQPTIVEMGELVPAIKAIRGKNKKEEPADIFEGETQSARIKILMDHFEISSVEFKTTNGVDSIVLNGQRELSNLKWIGCGPTYAIKDNDPDYRYISDLFQISELLKFEMAEYIINHKYAPAIDLELPFPDGPETNIDEQQY